MTEIFEKGWRFALDEFAFRQFDDPNYVGTRIPMDKKEFAQKINDLTKESELHAGYAPFCKHVFVENFTDATPGSVKITPELLPKIRSGYSARTSKELAVLSRWVEASELTTLAPAKYLDLILYSKEQLIKEAAAMQKPAPQCDSEWLIISIKAQNENYELPMTPITVMRNSMIEEGGSGVAIDREAYSRSVEYWQNHVMIK